VRAIGLVILSYDHFHQLNVLAVSFAGATIVAVTIRTGLTFRENSRILGLLRIHAVTDALTGLGNRRSLVDDLTRALADGSEASPRLLAIYDLDGFKLYNDTFGNPAGDALLTRLATALDRAVCDAFSAMTSKRPYRLSATTEQALAELRRCAGTQFDPEVVRIFCKLAARFDAEAEPRRLSRPYFRSATTSEAARSPLSTAPFR
jgi:Diguanylate cyclase, GGDEF domain